MKLDGKLMVIGGGQMAGALIEGLLKTKTLSTNQMIVSEPVESRREALRTRFQIEVIDDHRSVIQQASIVILATKPQVFSSLLPTLKIKPETLVISIAAGVTIATIESALFEGVRVVRVMPNTAALIQEAATGIAGGLHVTDEDLARTQMIFQAVGRTVLVPEHLLDAVTGLSGSGPAYIYVLIEALTDGGVRVGLPRETALELATQTVLGAAKMVFETKKHPAELKDMVTSPGGTTIAGIDALEQSGFRASVMNAVKAATDRSIELGQSKKH